MKYYPGYGESLYQLNLYWGIKFPNINGENFIP